MIGENWPLIRNVFLIHCAAVIAVIVVAAMSQVSLGDAHARVLQRRPIQLEQVFGDDNLLRGLQAVSHNYPHHGLPGCGVVCSQAAIQPGALAAELAHYE